MIVTTVFLPALHMTLSVAVSSLRSGAQDTSGHGTFSPTMAATTWHVSFEPPTPPPPLPFSSTGHPLLLFPLKKKKKKKKKSYQSGWWRGAVVQWGCCSIYISIFACISARLLRVHPVLQWSFFSYFATLFLATLQGFVYHHWGFGTDSSGAVPWGVWGFRLPPVRDSFSGTISIQGLAWGLASTYSRSTIRLLAFVQWFSPSSRPALSMQTQVFTTSPNRGLSVQHQVFIGFPSGASRGALHLRQLMVRGFQCGTQSSPVAHQGPSMWHQVLLSYLFRALSRAPCSPQGLSEAFSFHF